MIFDLFLSRDARDRRETIAYYDRVHALFEAALGRDFTPQTLARNLVIRVFHDHGLDLTSPLFRAFVAAAHKIIEDEQLFSFPILDRSAPLSMVEGAELRARLREKEQFLADPKRFDLWLNVLATAFVDILTRLPRGLGDGEALLSVPLVEALREPAVAITEVMRCFFLQPACDAELFNATQEKLVHNYRRASGITDPQSRKQYVHPCDARGKSPSELAESYLAGTPFLPLLMIKVPFGLPLAARLEHTHIVAGSGHGKTQLLQLLIQRDLKKAREGKGSLVVIDSQGDMLSTIARLEVFNPAAAESLAEQIVIIDPNDVAHPPCLNLFDFGFDRLDRYSAAEREKLLNGAIALYEYLFGALLGAELTQRQGVIFRYLARLLMAVPGATIHTLREFMEDPEAVRPYVARLDGTTRHFFESQFPETSYNDTRKQILTRLWGVMSNPVLERMFSHERNKIDLFDAMQRGKVVLINTAKDLLKREGCQILGRFFIAQIAQATFERAAVPSEKRRTCFVYVDEAYDYFDAQIGDLLNQARKYKVGLILAHQNLDQLDTRLRADIMSSTSIKLAGGVSAKDARSLSADMQCEPEFVQSARKERGHAEFACFIKNVTGSAVKVAVPFGVLEGEPRMDDADFATLLDLNRARYGAGDEEPAPAASPKARGAAGFELGEHERL